MRWLAAAVLALLLVGCSGSSKETQSYFSNLDEAQWLYFEPVEFVADSAADSHNRGALLFSVRHTSTYPFRNIWLEISQKKGSTYARTDTFEVMLADAFGRWYGSGMGASMRYTDTLAADYIVVPGARISLRHVMRVDTLRGVEQVGLILK